jgi:hypothetical protein
VERLPVFSHASAAAVAERGVDLLLVLPKAQPRVVHFWGGDQHPFRTEYVDHRGRDVVIIQAELEEGDSLTTGKAVEVRGHRGVQAGRTWYWRERGWVLAAPANAAIADRLSWLDVP